MARYKNARLDLRMLPSEKEKLIEKAKAARLTMTNYILALSEQKRIYIIDGVPELVVEITRIGTNVNQIAAVVNSYKSASDYQLKEVLNALTEVQRQLSEILKQLYSIDEEAEV